jgi:hypothetical protein
MPTEPEAIGFSNIWYPEGFQTAINHRLDEQTEIKIFSLPYFVATKWEAFKAEEQTSEQVRTLRIWYMF